MAAFIDRFSRVWARRAITISKLRALIPGRGCLRLINSTPPRPGPLPICPGDVFAMKFGVMVAYLIRVPRVM